MRAHKVPATYYSGWKNPNFKSSFYVFYKNDLTSKGILKSYNSVDKITSEHGTFMDEDFYYIHMGSGGIRGIEYKLKDEINDFLSEGIYMISCIDSVNCNGEPEKEGKRITIDDHEKYMIYKDDIHTWDIKDSIGNNVTSDEFVQALDNFIFERIGTVIENDYFAYYLEPKWNAIKENIVKDLDGLANNSNLNLSKKNDLVEFFVLQHLRVDGLRKQMIEERLSSIEDIFKELGTSEAELDAIKEEGVLSYEPYFYGILLDAARGDNKKIKNRITYIDSNYVIDVLETSGSEYITSTEPCVISKTEEGVAEEMLFPVDWKYCIRFRYKGKNTEPGKYIIQLPQEVRQINSAIVKASKDVVMSRQEYITNLI